MKTPYVSIILFLIFLSGCAKPTGYVKRDNYGGNQYGCNDKKISDDEYAIVAEGNKYSTPEHVAMLALYHAANVTINNGKNSFRIIKKTDENLPSHQLTMIPIPIVVGFIYFLPVAENSINEATSILIIKFCEEQTDTQSKCINAEQIINELKSTIEDNKGT